jgi:hypothetical protein
MKKRKAFPVLRAALLMAFAVCAGTRALAQAGDTWYVSAAGSDSNDGLSEAKAFKTLKKAAGMASSGTTRTVTVIGTLNDAGEDGGGGVFVMGGSFTQRGGTVRGNSASGAGGGVLVMGGGSFTQRDGTVHSNTAIVSGGGVFVFNGGSFTQQGGAVDGNSTEIDGGGVFVFSGAVFIQQGGTVTGNTAMGSGGGVFVLSGGVFTRQDGTVRGNAASRGADIYREQPP